MKLTMRLLSKSFILAGITGLLIVIFAPLASAQVNNGAFSLQVSPSPLIDVITPGQSKNLELKIRNTGTVIEHLRVDLRKFKVDNNNGQIELTDQQPTDVADWVTLSDPTMSIAPGASFTEKIKLNPPSNVGFSYSFAVVISRDKEPTDATGKTKLKGSVAVFTLLTVDRPGAVRKFDIVDFTSQKRLYEYLPAYFTVKLHNSGNTIVQPFGNIFIQRTVNSSIPTTVLKFNNAGAYMLPDTNRTFNALWSDGFPSFQSISAGDGTSNNKKLVWDWGKLQNFRFGKYYAKLVAVYNDGHGDVPVEAVLSFWVIPWKLLIVGSLILIVIIVGIVTIVKRPIRTIKRASTHKDEQKDA